MLSVADALTLILREVRVAGLQSAALADSLGRTLAEDVRAEFDSPPFDKSLVDGFAIRVADSSGRLPIVEVVLAGQVAQRAVEPGVAIHIMTGAPLPAGTEVVVPIELTREVTVDGQRAIEITTNISGWKPGTNIVRQAASTRRGDVVVAAGAELRPQELGAIAELGGSAVRVRKLPRVAVLATGDELVSIEETPGPGQIRNSNEVMLCAQVCRANADPIPLGIARDERQELRDRIASGVNADVLILSGGVSMGEKDLVPSELSAAGVRQVFHKVNVKPGKPVWFGVFDRADNTNCLVFGLPGNPVSSMVCFELFVRPALRRMLGIEPAEPRAISAKLTQPHTTKGDRPTYHPSRIDWTHDGPRVTPVPWVGSSDLRATVSANGMALFPFGDRSYPEGTLLDVIPW